jgi:hypothetical protein
MENKKAANALQGHIAAWDKWKFYFSVFVAFYKRFLLRLKNQALIVFKKSLALLGNAFLHYRIMREFITWLIKRCGLEEI